MEEKLRELEAQRLVILAEQKKYNKRAIPFFVIGAIGFLLGIAFPDTGALFMVIGFVLIIIGAIVASIGYKHIAQFNQMFKSNLITSLLKANYDNVTYEPKGHIPLDVFLKTGLTRKPDRWRGEDFISGEKNGVKFQVSEFHLEDRHVRRDSKGNTYVTYETFFKGRFFMFEFKRIFKHDLRISEKGLLNISFNNFGLKKIETESIAFNKKFSVLTGDDQHAFYIITPVMLEEIQRIERLFKGTIALLFQGNRLYVAINDNKNTLEPNIKVPLTGQSLDYYLVDILIMQEMIHAFDLDGSKFMEIHE
ncbi:DUF3137 domain-containing protein [Acholeplasma hippikon]|nr:DUF3137 domain-containing protein [Acholeplasma hippikon]